MGCWSWVLDSELTRNEHDILLRYLGIVKEGGGAASRDLDIGKARRSAKGLLRLQGKYHQR